VRARARVVSKCRHIACVRVGAHARSRACKSAQACTSVLGVCVRACVRACMHACMHARMHACVCVCVCVCVPECSYIDVIRCLERITSRYGLHVGLCALE
jgi:hypothetical protein